MKRSSVRIELVTLRAYAVRVARVCNRALIDLDDCSHLAPADSSSDLQIAEEPTHFVVCAFDCDAFKVGRRLPFLGAWTPRKTR